MSERQHADIDLSRLALRSLDSMIVVDQEAVIVWANDEALRRFATPDGALVGVNAFALIHPDDVGAGMQTVNAFTGRLRGPTNVRSGELRVRSVSGEYLWCEIRFDLDDTVAERPVFVITLRSTHLNVRFDEVVHALVRGDRLRDVLDAVLRAVEVEDPQGDSLEGVAGRRLYGVSWLAGAHRQVHARSLPPDLVWTDRDEDPWRRAVVEGVPVTAFVEELDPRLRDAADALGVVTCVAFPVVDEGAGEAACLVLWADEDVSHVVDLPRGRMSRAVVLIQLALSHHHDRELLITAATRDALTKLANRRAIFAATEEHLSTSLSLSAARDLAVVFIDLDGFKPINDQYGHHIGDLVLAETARRLLAAVEPDDLVGRLGGDEFVVLLRDKGARVGAMVDQLRASTCQPFTASGIELTIAASIGMTHARPDDTADQLLTRADQAMYAAKRGAGTGRVPPSVRR